MKKLLLILTLSALSLTAFAQQVDTPDAADENCDVSVVSGGGEPTESGGQPAGAGAGSARSE